MEADRFNQNHTLFIICMICLVISLSLFTLAFYVVPFMIWGWHYSVPEFVFTWSQYFVETYGYTQAGSYGLVFLMLFVPALIAGLISYVCSNFIENRVLDLNVEPPPEAEKPPRQIKETLGLTMKVLILIALIVGVIVLMQWLFLPGASPEE